jgi:hypothetical protein
MGEMLRLRRAAAHASRHIHCQAKEMQPMRILDPDDLYQSIIIRCQCTCTAEQRCTWHAEVEHIQSGSRHTFGNLDELVDYVQRELQMPVARSSINKSPA